MLARLHLGALLKAISLIAVLKEREVVHLSAPRGAHNPVKYLDDIRVVESLRRANKVRIRIEWNNLILVVALTVLLVFITRIHQGERRLSETHLKEVYFLLGSFTLVAVIGDRGTLQHVGRAHAEVGGGGGGGGGGRGGRGGI